MGLSPARHVAFKRLNCFIASLTKVMCWLLAANHLLLAGYLDLFWYFAGKGCEISGIHLYLHLLDFGVAANPIKIPLT